MINGKHSFIDSVIFLCVRPSSSPEKIKVMGGLHLIYLLSPLSSILSTQHIMTDTRALHQYGFQLQHVLHLMAF